MSSEVILEKRSIPWYGVLAIILVSVLGAGALALFAWQTWEFVDWLFPSEQFLYKVLAVANFDVMSVVWICLELFVPLTDGSKNICIIAGGFDFILSILCTIVQMVRSSQQQFSASALPTGWITLAFILVILALVINLISFVFLFRGEWPYISGQKVRGFYPVDKPTSPRGGKSVKVEEEKIRQLEAPKEKPLTVDDIIRILDERERNKSDKSDTGKQPVVSGARRDTKPFLASQAREQTALASKPKKKLPPLRNPFKKQGD